MRDTKLRQVLLSPDKSQQHSTQAPPPRAHYTLKLTPPTNQASWEGAANPGCHYEKQGSERKRFAHYH